MFESLVSKGIPGGSTPSQSPGLELRCMPTHSNAGTHLTKLRFAAPGLAPLKDLPCALAGLRKAASCQAGGGYLRGDRSSQVCCSAFVPLGLSAS